MTGPKKFGAHERVKDPGFICNATGDPYAKPPRPGMRTMIKDAFLKGGHEKDFFPAKTVTYQHAKHHSVYEHMPNPPLPKKVYR